MISPKGKRTMLRRTTDKRGKTPRAPLDELDQYLVLAEAFAGTPFAAHLRRRGVCRRRLRRRMQ